MTAGRSLVLLGYRGAGKTTLGRALAERTGIEFVDTDEIVERRIGKTIAELFAAGDEALFRREESAVIVDLDPEKNQIIATGGGAPTIPENIPYLRALGVNVYLKAGWQCLAKRIAGSKRPSLTGRPIEQEVARVLAQREPQYQALAHYEILTEGRGLEEICDELQQLWRDAQNHHIW